MKEGLSTYFGTKWSISVWTTRPFCLRGSWPIDLRKSFIESASRGLRTLVGEHKHDGFEIPSGRRQIFATCTQDLLTFTSQVTTDYNTPQGEVLT